MSYDEGNINKGKIPSVKHLLKVTGGENELAYILLTWTEPLIENCAEWLPDPIVDSVLERL